MRFSSKKFPSKTCWNTLYIRFSMGIYISKYSKLKYIFNPLYHARYYSLILQCCGFLIKILHSELKVGLGSSITNAFRRGQRLKEDLFGEKERRWRSFKSFEDSRHQYQIQILWVQNSFHSKLCKRYRLLFHKGWRNPLVCCTNCK